jgi:hypothetical protein
MDRKMKVRMSMKDLQKGSVTPVMSIIDHLWEITHGLVSMNPK